MRRPRPADAEGRRCHRWRELMRYQVLGPPHFGIANLRTVQDWIVRRRLLQVGGVVAVNTYELPDPWNAFPGRQDGTSVCSREGATTTVGSPPRSGIAGRDRVDDIAFGDVVMANTYQTGRMLPLVDATIHALNQDGSLPPGVKVVPYYDCSDMVGLTTHTMTLTLVFGSLLVLLIQGAFLGDPRALIPGLIIPCVLLLAIMTLTACGESARRTQAAAARALPPGAWTGRLRLILMGSMRADRAVLFSVLIIVATFAPLATMQGVEHAIFGPMTRTYVYALAGALIPTFAVTPVLASAFLPARVQESETLIVRGLHPAYDLALRFALAQRAAVIGSGLIFLAMAALGWTQLGSQLLPHLGAGNFWTRPQLLIVPVRLVLSLSLLYGLCNSIKDSLLALTGIPFAVAAGMLGLSVTGHEVDISAVIGLISLCGIAVMTGLLLRSRCTRTREGLPPAAMFAPTSEPIRPQRGTNWGRVVKR